MAWGNVTCRHTRQTGLLNCGLEHAGMGLRNVHTPVQGGWGCGGGGQGREGKGKLSSAYLQSSQISTYRTQWMSLMKAVNHLGSLYWGQTSGITLCTEAPAAFMPCAPLIRGGSQNGVCVCTIGSCSQLQSAVNHVMVVTFSCWDQFMSDTTPKSEKWLILQKKVYYLLKCFTLGMTMCLHNTYSRVGWNFVHKKIITKT